MARRRRRSRRSWPAPTPPPAPPERDDLDQHLPLELAIADLSDQELADVLGATGDRLRRLRSFEARARRYRKRIVRGELVAGDALACVHALVSGTAVAPYEVSLERDDDRILATCTCPYSGGATACKHGWAVLDRLQAELQAEVTRRYDAPDSAADRDWRTALVEADRILAAHETATSGEARSSDEDAAERVVFRVRAGDRLEVTAHLQRRRQGGSGFTRGAAIGIGELLNISRSNLRPDVEAAAFAYRAASLFLYGYRYDAPAPTPHSSVLLALVGSPHVYDANDPARHLEVRPGALALHVSLEDHDGEERLRVAPTIAEVSDRAAPRDAARADAVRVYPLTVVQEEEQLLVARDEEGLVVGRAGGPPYDLAVALQGEYPADARSVLLERLAVAPVVLPVFWPAELLGDPIDGDARTRLLLTPVEDGLRAILRVRPHERAPLALPGSTDASPCVVGDDGRVHPVERDRGAERATAAAVAAELGLALPDPSGDDGPGKAARLGPEAALELVARVDELAASRSDLVVEWPKGERLRVSRPATPADLRVRVEDGPDWLGIRGEVEVDGLTIELAALLAALRAGKRYVALDGRRWLRVSEELRSRLAALADHAVVGPKAPRGALALDATAGPALEDVLDAAGEAELSEGWLALRRRLASARAVRATPPRLLKAQLRPYQLEGFVWLKRLATWGVGACLADDMGLGKTVQAIALLVDRRRKGPALVVAPTSVGTNWQREIARFAPCLRAHLYREADDREALVAGLRGGDVLIVSYDLARRDERLLTPITWATAVFDEAQRVKNAATKTARALRALRAEARVALSGTPIENHTGELWSMFRLLAPGLLGSWDAFRERFARPIERDGDDERREGLARLVRPFVLRRRKDEVLTELPARTEVTLDVDLDDGERRRYDDERLDAVARIAAGTGDHETGRFEVLAALTRLRQLACHPALVDADWDADGCGAAASAAQAGSSKLRAILQLVDELRGGGHRALVFSQFTRWLRTIAAALDEREIAHLYLDGTTPAAARQDRVDAFQAGEGDLFLISLKAGGQGLNLTAADYVIHTDPWWNPAVEDQATDRAHRIGQRRPVTVYRMITRATIEEQVVALHARKRNLVEGLLAGADAAGKLSTEDLIDLIRSGGQPGGPATSPPRAPRRERAAAPPSGKRAAVAASPEARTDAEIVKARRSDLGLTQRALADRLGVSQTTLSRWEAGRSTPSPEQLRQLEGLEPARAPRPRRRS